MGVLRDIFAIKEGQAGGNGDGNGKSRPKRADQAANPAVGGEGDTTFESYQPETKRAGKRSSNKRT